jgi:O-acetyl-ADP-ribose deacetylase (regulator of RNase III)
MESAFKIGTTVLKCITGDITRQDTAAIVNAANSTLLGGGGVDGAIHRAGGPQILEECRSIADAIGALPPGDAVITGGGSLPARFVIHTVGPIWRGGAKQEAATLAHAYFNSLSLAAEKNIATISFPSISTGAYRFPIERAAAIAAKTVIEFVRARPFEEIRFVLFTDSDYRIYAKAVATLIEE